MAEASSRALLKGEHEDGGLDFPFEFPLKTAIAVNGERNSVLVLNEPTADLLIKHDLLYGVTGQNLIPALSAMSGASEVVLGQIPARDMMKICKVLTRFFDAAGL